MTKSSGLGTFGGVYTPSILTILGVIMYLRLGWVVGNVGLLGALVIVTLSTSITFLTALSVSAIATDRVVRVGGAYYMISRSLGIETGGAVGIPLYFAQAISVGLYTVGFAESVAIAFPSLNQLYVGLLATTAVAVLALTSAEVAIRAQYFIMVAIAVSLLSLTFGPAIPGVEPQGWGIPDTSVTFWTVFAVFFPAVTGIMAGVSMSGDLRDPTRAIPRGTLAAVGTGYLIYMLLPLLLALRADTASLLEDSLVMLRLSAWGPLILLGVWGATLSSALGSILGAPRVLQALARDGILPRSLSWLGRGTGELDEPRLGTLATLGVAIATVCLGDLNLIAPVLTMFFLTTYLVLNVAAGVEGLLKSPSFRPAFPVHWSLSLAGAAGCLAVMFLIDAIATVLAACVALGIYFWLQRRELTATWGDVRRGLWLALVRIGILHLDRAADDPKNWRPHVLVLSGIPHKRWALIELAEALTHNRGLITVASVLPSGSRTIAQQVELEETLRDYLERQGVQALARVITAPNPFVGAQKLVETYGLGAVVPNTVLLGDSEQVSCRADYCQMLAETHAAGRSILILRENREQGFGQRQRVDIWWGGMQANGSLMLLLAYLLRHDQSWREATIYLNLVVPDAAAAQAAQLNLDRMLLELRVGATSRIIVADGRPFDEILCSTSAAADLVFLGMATPREQYATYYETLQRRVAPLPTTLFVLAAPDFAFAEVLVEKGVDSP